jgi:tetratricopeptide (TPR) repeat protein
MKLTHRSTSRVFTHDAGGPLWLVRAACGLLALASTTLIASAQYKAPDMNDPVIMSQGGNPVGMLIVYVVGSDGKSVTSQGVVTIFRSGEVSGQHQDLPNNGVVRFTSLANASYTVIVSAAGYEDAREETEITATKTLSEVKIALDRPDGDTSEEPDAKGMMLAPKAKKEAQKGMDAIRVGQYDEAQKHLEAAYQLAPGNPDLNDRMAELFLVTKNYDKAQTYLQKALSIEPDNAGALTDQGWLHVQQDDNAAAETVLQRAVTADPQRWFAHWLLGIAYLRQGSYESAREEAATAVKVGKGAAADAQYLLGESLALLGRNEDATNALQQLIKDSPENSNAPAARVLIAKLQASGTEALPSAPSNAAQSAPALNSRAANETSR